MKKKNDGVDFNKHIREEYNQRIREEHTEMRKKILALRPMWEVAKLEAITHSYSSGGLVEILQTITTADEMDAKFK